MDVIVTRNQPQGAIRLINSSLTQNLFSALAYDGKAYHDAARAPSSVVNAAGPAVFTTKGQVGGSFDGNTQYATSRFNNENYTYGTFLAVVAQPPTGSYKRIICLAGAGNNAIAYAQFNDYNTIEVGTNSNFLIASIPGGGDSKAHVIAFTLDAGGHVILYYDGVKLGDSGIPLVSFPITSFDVGRLQYRGSYYYGLLSSVPLALMWGNRVLTDAKVKDVSANPWQVLAPPQRLLFATSTTAITSRPNRFPFALGIYNQ